MFNNLLKELKANVHIILENRGTKTSLNYSASNLFIYSFKTKANAVIA